MPISLSTSWLMPPVRIRIGWCWRRRSPHAFARGRRGRRRPGKVRVPTCAEHVQLPSMNRINSGNSHGQDCSEVSPRDSESRIRAESPGGVVRLCC